MKIHQYHSNKWFITEWLNHFHANFNKFHISLSVETHKSGSFHRETLVSKSRVESFDVGMQRCWCPDLREWNDSYGVMSLLRLYIILKSFEIHIERHNMSFFDIYHPSSIILYKLQSFDFVNHENWKGNLSSPVWMWLSRAFTCKTSVFSFK